MQIDLKVILTRLPTRSNLKNNNESKNNKNINLAHLHVICRQDLMQPLGTPCKL